MHPVPRILIQLFGPALFGALQLIALGIAAGGGSSFVIDTGHPFKLLLQIVLGIPMVLAMYLLGAVVVCGIQLLVYVLAMECAYKYGLKRRSVQMILFSTLLGLLSGFSIFIQMSELRLENAYICLVGALSGLLTAAVLYFSEPKRDT